MKKCKVPIYPFTIRPLSSQEGGGYFIEFPDLPGCISDGETIEEAIQQGQEAVADWLLAAQASHRVIPKPGQIEQQSGKWVQRVPKSIHLRLVEKAKAEGVSLNTLVVALLAEGMGKQGHSTKHRKFSHR